MVIRCLYFAPLLFTYFVIPSAFALKCHQCSTEAIGEEDCESLLPESTKYLKNCTSVLHKSCRKQEQWVPELLNQKEGKRTIRQCASVEFDPEKPCYYRAGFGAKINVCHCTGDGCNTAAKTIVMSSIFSAGILFILLKMLL